MVARQLCILGFRKLGCPLLHQRRIEDAGRPLRGLEFGVALLAETLEFLESDNPGRTVAVCK